ncbi:tRNA (guanine(46)-N(7))-methyltransferase TrmB [Bdellovibrio sp. HCB337]|uniref:tRNA (guanine(46)-N(7))-methyltransferase TrmB n=1 Tax=Bdellovibrio sp. HCB337 TaxID=3394358 RepID=UPI0039A72896
MSEIFHRPKINLTRTLPIPNAYTLALDGEYSNIAFNEERAPANKGKWRSDVFKAAESKPMDLEIGTGAGDHFAHYAYQNPDRLLVGLELKYKPLIQSIRRATKGGSKNAAIARYHAFNIDELFIEGELNNVFIHFPDPWTSPKKPKNRVVNVRILDLLYNMQRPGSYIDFKTDSRVYFLWALDEIKQSKYKVVRQTLNLHQSEWQSENFMTGFEKIFTKQGIEINYIRLLKE